VDVDRGVDQVRVVPGRWVTGAARHRYNARLEKPSTRGSPRQESSLRPGHRPAGTSLWEHAAGYVGRCPAQDLVLLRQQPVAPRELAQLLRAGPGRVDGLAVLPVGELQLAGQTGLGDPEVPGNLGH
jgi:hypothetical protein